MLLTNEDILAIEDILKKNLKGVESRLDGVESRLEGVESRLDGVESRLDGVESRLDGVESRLDGVESRLDTLEHDVTVIKVDMLENNVIPRLNTIEQCYLDTSKRYMDKTEEFENAIADISVMKRAIQKNSEDIRGLQLKQA